MVISPPDMLFINSRFPFVLALDILPSGLDPLYNSYTLNPYIMFGFIPLPYPLNSAVSQEYWNGPMV